MSAGRSRGRWPVVTLTTDFGLHDSYVAEMKGALLSLARAVHLVDITHDVPAHDVAAAALVLESAVPAFPPSSVHVAVVDPGVGTPRRGLIVEATGHRFVGPDNGIFTPFLAAAGWRAVELLAADLRRPSVSPTFHGRDIFAPAAAHLALGVPVERFGPPVADPVRLPIATVQSGRGGLRGIVLHVDRFGNLVTSIRAVDLRTLGSPVRVSIRGRLLPLVRTYGELGSRGVGALVGSHDRLEVAVREGSAADHLGARRGTPVIVRRMAADTREGTDRTSNVRSRSGRDLSKTTARRRVDGA